MSDEQESTIRQYLGFAADEARGTSPSYEAWAEGVAATPRLVEMIASLPPRSRQPNLVFAAARLLGAAPGDTGSLQETLDARWGELVELVTSRSTQTNEVGRCAVLLPLLAALPQPLALLEVGAAAGLCLHPDRCSYRYLDQQQVEHRLDPPDGPSRALIECRLRGAVPLPTGLPEVVWRGGIDLHPRDPHSDADVDWLEALVWPEHDGRRRRLRDAVGVAREHDDASIVRGDLVERLGEVADRVPAGATLVVLHSAVLSYLPSAARARFVETVDGLPGHWISNEGHGVLDVGGPVPARAGSFAVALDGVARAHADPHGAWLEWL